MTLAALLCGTGCRDGGQAAATGRTQLPVPVTVAPVVHKAVSVEVSAVGSVQEFAVVSVVSQVSGRVEKVHFEEGNSVEKGDLLFSLDRRPFAATLSAAVARRDRDQVLAANAKSDLGRYQSLVGKDYVSREQFDQVQASAAAAEATLRADLSAIESATLDLQYATIRSPIDGRTGSLLVNQGNVVKANDKPLLVIRQVKPIYVRFAVPEQHLPAIRQRMAQGKPAVRATGRGQAGDPVMGELTFIENAVDPATGSISMKALFQNQDEALWPGQYVDVVLELRVEADAVVVPAAAIQQSREGEYAFVLGKDDTVQLRKVEVIRTVNEEAVVGKGLVPGESVVTDGQLRLVDGSRVEIKQAQPEKASPEQAQPEHAQFEKASPEQAQSEHAQPEQAQPEQAQPEKALPARPASSRP